METRITLERTDFPGETLATTIGSSEAAKAGTHEVGNLDANGVLRVPGTNDAYELWPIYDYVVKLKVVTNECGAATPYLYRAQLSTILVGTQM